MCQVEHHAPGALQRTTSTTREADEVDVTELHLALTIAERLRTAQIQAGS